MSSGPFLKGMPLPAATPTTLPFWEACAKHRLVIQHCDACGKFRHPPSPLCPACQSTKYDWVESKGIGTIYTFMVAHHPVADVLNTQVPYAVIVVQLDDCGEVKMTSNLVDTPVGEIRIGMKVKVAWDDVDEGVTLPRFVRG